MTDLRRPTDDRPRGRGPSIPEEERNEFIADVEQAMPLSALRDKWKHRIPLEQGRTLDNWRAWARRKIAARSVASSGGDRLVGETNLAPQRRWTIEEFDRIPDGTFPEGERVELIEGLIYTKMGQNDPHITALYAVFAALQEAFGSGFHLGMQVPLKLGDDSKPEPDVLVRRGTWRDYDGRRPDPKKDIPLVVEVADSTLADDRARKAPLYARHGIPEYWIVNLRDRTLEVRRRPRSERGDYFETLVFTEADKVEIGGGQVAISDLLPRMA